MKKILIITSSFDSTIDYIQQLYQKKAQFLRLNLDHLDEYKIEISNIIKIKSINWSVDFSEVASIYYRKPILPDLQAYDREFHQLMKKDLLTFLYGIVDSFEGPCLTKVYKLQKAENKILQLAAAQKIGFSIPPSLITNDKALASKFVENNNSIIKPLSLGKFYFNNMVSFIHTNLVDPKIPINNIHLSPSYFQEYIDKDYEVRITIINSEIFCVKIETSEKIDWRKADSKDITYSVTDVPFEIKKQCLALLVYFNLKFGAFDFLVKDGKFIFLEVNPNGQWLWLEQELNLPISNNIFAYLNLE